MAGPIELDPSPQMIITVRQEMLQVAKDLQKPRSKWGSRANMIADLVDDIDYSSGIESTEDDREYLTAEAEHDLLQCLLLPSDDQDDNFNVGPYYTAQSLVKQFADFWNNSEAERFTSTLFVDDKRIVFTGAVSYGGNEFPNSHFLQAASVFRVPDEFGIVY